MHLFRPQINEDPEAARRLLYVTKPTDSSLKSLDYKVKSVHPDYLDQHLRGAKYWGMLGTMPIFVPSNFKEDVIIDSARTLTQHKITV